MSILEKIKEINQNEYDIEQSKRRNSAIFTSKLDCIIFIYK